MDGIRAITGGILRPGGLGITDRVPGLCSYQDETGILDAGFGAGSTTKHLADCCKKGVYGVDPSGQPLLLHYDKSSCIEPDMEMLLSIGYYLLVAKKVEERTENER
jgi:hypothetical protein